MRLRQERKRRIRTIITYVIAALFAAVFAVITFHEQKEVKVLSAEVVVSWCSKDLKWLPSFLLGISGGTRLTNVYVYSKCGRKDVDIYSYIDREAHNVVVIRKPNFGQNDGTFAEHIAANYQNLSDIVFFVKDSMYSYPIPALLELNIAPQTVTQSLISGEDFVCFRAPDQAGTNLASEWHLRREVWKFRLPEYITADNYAEKRTDQDFALSRKSMCGFLLSHLSETEFFQLRSQVFVRVCYGGEFAARSSSIKRVSLETWVSFASELNSHRSSGELHYMERTWASILDSKEHLKSSQHELEKLSVLDFHSGGGSSYPGLLHLPLATTAETSKMKHVLKRCESNFSHQLQTNLFVLVTHTLSLEGAPLYLRFLTRRLIEHGHNVIIVAPSDGPARSLFLEDAASQVLIWPELLTASSLIAEILTFVHKQTSLVPGTIIFNTILFAGYVSQNNPECANNPRVLWIIHEWAIVPGELEILGDGGERWFGDDINEIRPEVLRGTALRADALIFVADAQQALWPSVQSLVKTFVIPGYAEARQLSSERKVTRKSLGIKERSFVLTVVGTVCARKRQTWAVNALNKLIQKNLDVFLLVVGDFSQVSRDLLLDMAMKKDRLIILPSTESIDEIWDISDLHLSASQSEVFPLNTLEAMIHKVPVIATDVGGTREQYLSKEVRWMLVKDPSEDRFISAVEKAVDIGKPKLRSLGEQFQTQAQIHKSTFHSRVDLLVSWLQLLRSEIEVCGAEGE